MFSLRNEERLTKLILPTLEERSKRGDKIMMYKGVRIIEMIDK